MTILPIIKNDIQALTKVSDEFDSENPPMDATQLAYDLTDTMIDARGLGLSAIQVGIPYRIFSMRGAVNESGKPEMHCFFNPKIVSVSNKIIKLDEGCLSFPGLVVPIKRPMELRMRFTTANGQTDTRSFGGITARVIQH